MSPKTDCGYHDKDQCLYEGCCYLLTDNLFTPTCFVPDRREFLYARAFTTIKYRPKCQQIYSIICYYFILSCHVRAYMSMSMFTCSLLTKLLQQWLLLCRHLTVPRKTKLRATIPSYRVPMIVNFSAAAGVLAAGIPTVSDDVIASLVATSF